MKPPSRQLLMVASSIALAMTLLMALCLSLAQGTGSLIRVTVGSESDRSSRFPSLSADGTRIAFVSDSDFFGQGIQADQWEIWLYDTRTMTLTRVTTASDSNRFSFGPSLSADGTKVAFYSDSDLLNQGIPAGQFEIWLYDTVMMTYTRITTASDSNRHSRGLFPSLNANGEKVAFRSDSDFLNQGIPADQHEVWLYDTTTMTYTRITTASDSNRDSGESDSFKGVSLSTDGTRIAFASDADLLNQGIPDNQYEVWLYDTTTMTYTRITTASDSSERIGTLSISADGTKVAFDSNSDYLSQGIPVGQLEVWLYDTTAMALTRVTTASESNRWSFHSSLNANGTKIAFMSDADLLGQGDVLRGQSEIWLYDTMDRTLTRVTASGSDRASEAPSLNADGTKIAFMSDADFLSQGIPEYQKEIWLYEAPEMPADSIYLPIILKDSSYFFLSQRTKKPVFLKKTGFYAASAYQLPHVTSLLF